MVTTESGLQYEIIEEGDGELAGPDDTVELNYTGKLIDGETFDSSEGRGPANFPVTGVIPGFSEGLQLLPIGTTAKLYIPADLAYGDSPQGPGGPGSTLIFDVELLGIQSAPAAPSLAEQLEMAEAQLADDLEMVREQGEQQIADLKAQLEASGESATVGGGEGDVREEGADVRLSASPFTHRTASARRGPSRAAAFLFGRAGGRGTAGWRAGTTDATPPSARRKLIACEN